MVGNIVMFVWMAAWRFTIFRLEKKNENKSKNVKRQAAIQTTSPYIKAKKL